MPRTRRGLLPFVVAGSSRLTQAKHMFSFVATEAHDMKKAAIKNIKPAALPLKGRVALVAGATRGAGRGVARALAEAGATVYCTGRSVTGKPSPYARPETIDETAAMIRKAGGTAIA